ncbi:MAG: M23 family metallopeptidase [Candidatus Latescibacteria bacterium]|nr:M23 family metallopeptidase [Candidatus Latescibacterota bacterium]
MAWKRLTFILIPHSQNTVKQFKVRRTVLYGMIFFLVAAIGVMIFYIVGFKGKSFYHKKTEEIVSKNQLLLKHIAVFDSSLASMKTQVAHLESINTAIIEESRISAMDLNRFGIAGEGMTGAKDSFLPNRVLAVIDRLDRESEAFEQNFNGLFDECLKHSDYLSHVPSIRPSRGIITKEFGRSFDELSQTEKTHPGVDINDIEGMPVVATADGIIHEINDSKELGRYIIIDHQNGYTTRYAHLQPLKQMQNKIRLKKGDKVVRGQQIGAIGRTGVSVQAIPAHLMYSVYHHGIPQNPQDYFFASDFIAARPDSAPVVGAANINE